jgi:uncharacterized membrane protein
MENTEIAKPKGVDSKIIAGISYFGLIGLIVAFVLSKENKSELVLFHLKQAAGLWILHIVFTMCTFVTIIICVLLPFLLILVFPVVGIINTCFLILMIMGIINGFTEKMKHLPIIGKKSDALLSKYIK